MDNRLQDFLCGNQMVTWITDKKSGNQIVTTIQLTDYLKSGNWMFLVTKGPITEFLLYFLEDQLLNFQWGVVV